MEKNRAMQELVKYREKLIQYGKVIAEENPDHLEADELQALVYRIFEELNKINTGLGYPYHNIDKEIPATVSKERAEELFVNFVDFYNIICTPTSRMYNYIVENYSIDRYPKILCVRDGENSHLERKLQVKGYDVVSVDSAVKNIFPERIKIETQKSAEFHENCNGDNTNNSEKVIEWANLVVGSRVSNCAEDLVSLGKPAVFNISANLENNNVHFKGIPITSSKTLVRELSRCSGVSVKRDSNDMLLKDDELIFVCNGRERVDDSR